jgi:hypothetical protein
VLGLLVPLAAPALPGAAVAQSPRSGAEHGVSRSVDTIRVGCSGGRTGNGGGNLITGDGQLTRYTKPLRSPRAYTPLRRDSAAAMEVFAALERIPFRALHHAQVSDMTCVLELRDRAGEHSVTWAAGGPPSALEPALAALRHAFGDDRAWH